MRNEVSALDIVLVADAMSEDFETVRPDLPVRELAGMARTRRTRSWPVVDEGERMVGIVTETDVQRAILDQEDGAAGTEAADPTVRSVMTRAVLTCSPGDTLREAFRRFTEEDVQQIPVLDPDNGVLIGVLRRHEMLWAYKELREEHQRLLDQTRAVIDSPDGGTVQLEVQVESWDHAIADRQLRDLSVPANVLIAFIRRGERSFVPRGDARIEPGDVLVLIATRKHESELREWCASWATRTGTAPRMPLG